MEPRSPEDGVTSLVGLPSRDMIYAAGFCLGRSDGMVGTPRRRGDGVEAAGVCQAGQPAAPLALLLCGLVGRKVLDRSPTTLRGVCGRYRTAEICPHKISSQAVQSFQMKVARNCSSATPSYVTRCQQPQRPITALQPTAQRKPAFLRAVPSRAAKTALTQ